MATHPTSNATGYKTFLDDDTGDFDGGDPLLVSLSSDGLTVVPATVVADIIGVFDGKLDVSAAGDNLHNNVRLINGAGTARMKVETAAGITQSAGGTPVYLKSGEAGKISATVNGVAVGRLLGPTAAANDIVEVLLLSPAV